MGSTAVPFLPLDSCRWSCYPFDFPFQSPPGNFPGMLSEVGSCFPGCQLSAALNKLVGFKVISWPSSNARKSREVLSLLQRWDEVCLL